MYLNTLTQLSVSYENSLFPPCTGPMVFITTIVHIDSELIVLLQFAPHDYNVAPDQIRIAGWLCGVALRCVALRWGSVG